jgi:beta-galactosidase
MPSDEVIIAPKDWRETYNDPSFMCSAYDNVHAPWSSTHEETWDVVKHTPYVGGQFIWTGFDYIGEPTPYGFPARSSYFGIIDLAGQPKDVYYMYQSEWTNKPVLYLFPHWNWQKGQEVDLWCYYNHADEVELFVNGKSQGIRRKQMSNEKGEMRNDKDGLCTEYHVGWRVRFEPGEVKAVARKDGRVVRQQTIRTAGQPARVRLTIDYQGRDLTFVTADIVDADGNLCPWAENSVYFTASDGAKVIATDNGCQTSMERFTATQRRAFFGRCMAVIRGKGTVEARAVGLDKAQLTIHN